jgi:hypothetical protein
MESDDAQALVELLSTGLKEDPDAFDFLHLSVADMMCRPPKRKDGEEEEEEEEASSKMYEMEMALILLQRVYQASGDEVLGEAKENDRCVIPLTDEDDDGGDTVIDDFCDNLCLMLGGTVAKEWSPNEKLLKVPSAAAPWGQPCSAWKCPFCTCSSNDEDLERCGACNKPKCWTCWESECGVHNQNVSACEACEAERWWKCPTCGVEIERDINVCTSPRCVRPKSDPSLAGVPDSTPPAGFNGHAPNPNGAFTFGVPPDSGSAPSLAGQRNVTPSGGFNWPAPNPNGGFTFGVPPDAGLAPSLADQRNVTPSGGGFTSHNSNRNGGLTVEVPPTGFTFGVQPESANMDPCPNESDGTDGSPAALDPTRGMKPAALTKEDTLDAASEAEPAAPTDNKPGSDSPKTKTCQNEPSADSPKTDNCQKVGTEPTLVLEEDGARTIHSQHPPGGMELVFTKYQTKPFNLPVRETKTLSNGVVVELLAEGRLMYAFKDGMTKLARVPVGASAKKYWCTSCANGINCTKHILPKSL